jgi:hypothetical protein
MLLLLRIRSGETSLFCGTKVINQVHDDLGFGLRVYMLMGSNFLLSDNFVTVLIYCCPLNWSFIVDSLVGEY